MSGMVEAREARDGGRQGPAWAGLVQWAKEFGFLMEGTEGLLTAGYS